jgi:hypothetical protein
VRIRHLYPMLAMALLAPASALAARAEILPEDVAKASFLPATDAIRGLGGKPLWTENTDGGFVNRYRLSYFGILRYRVMVQIDEKPEGVALLRANVTFDRKSVERIRTHLSKKELAEFKGVASTSGLWTIHPEFWITTVEDDICLDGMEAVLEWRGPKGYRYSQGNTSCAAPEGMNRLVERMIALARIRSNKRWLPWTKSN